VIATTSLSSPFLHSFNIFENQNYVGLLPDLKHYSSCYMQDDERDRFFLILRFLSYNKAKQSNYIFDFTKELYIIARTMW